MRAGLGTGWNTGAMSGQVGGQPAGRAGRYQRSFTGMIGAMIVLLLVIGAYMAFRGINRNDPGNPVEAVEWKQPAQFAREDATFDVLAPAELPEGWIATSVRYRAGAEGSWHLGMLTDRRRYVGLEQSAGPVSSMVERFVDPEATQTGEVTVAGERWQTWSDPGEDHALVRRVEGTTTLVVGTEPQDVLADFAATLR